MKNKTRIRTNPDPVKLPVLTVYGLYYLKYEFTLLQIGSIQSRNNNIHMTMTTTITTTMHIVTDRVHPVPQ